MTFALGSLSLLAPITTSLVVFGEPAEALTLSGIALLVVAAPLIAYRRMPLLPAAKVGLYWAVVAGLLGFTAATLVSWKIINEVTPAVDRGAFVFATFAGATATAGPDARLTALARWSGTAIAATPPVPGEMAPRHVVDPAADHHGRWLGPVQRRAALAFPGRAA